MVLLVLLFACRSFKSASTLSQAPDQAIWASAGVGYIYEDTSWGQLCWCVLLRGRAPQSDVVLTRFKHSQKYIIIIGDHGSWLWELMQPPTCFAGSWVTGSPWASQTCGLCPRVFAEPAGGFTAATGVQPAEFFQPRLVHATWQSGKIKWCHS
jgi:hypothetical protein